jgi:flagellar motor protein MotB
MRRRRLPPPRRGHGALWSIIYIDLMTQIMAFFVIVWTLEHGAKATQTASLGTGMGAGVGMGDQTVRMVDLPGDVLFPSGETELGADGRAILDRLFGEPASGVLSFDRGGLAQRKLVIHGHTDDVGPKDKNFELGYRRAWSVFAEIRRHSRELPDHVVLCTHADNTPASPPLAPRAAPTPSERAAIQAARAKNRRIAIEDLVVMAPPAEPDPQPPAPQPPAPQPPAPQPPAPQPPAPQPPAPQPPAPQPPAPQPLPAPPAAAGAPAPPAAAE